MRDTGERFRKIFRSTNRMSDQGQPGETAHACKPSIQETEAGEFLGV